MSEKCRFDENTTEWAARVSNNYPKLRAYSLPALACEICRRLCEEGHVQTAAKIVVLLFS